MVRQQRRRQRRIDAVRTDVEIPTEALEILDAQAVELAERHGLQPERVLRVLARIALEYDDRLAEEEPCAGEELAAASLLWGPSLERALEYLEADQALSLFEHESVAALGTRDALIEYLIDEDTPCYTLDELAGHIEALIAHLQANRETLLTTGRPRTRSHASRWLDLRLARLYSTTLDPDVVQMGDFVRGIRRLLDDISRAPEDPPEELRRAVEALAEDVQALEAGLEEGQAARSGRLAEQAHGVQQVVVVAVLGLQDDHNSVVAQGALRLS